MKDINRLIPREFIVIDDMPPETIAMLQALYSRSPRSVKKHLADLRTADPAKIRKFMEMFYVGYGHKSIGDCGTTTIFAEHVSCLAAKAIQDTLLYNGQEASTRYLDMFEQEALNPLQSELGGAIQSEWMAIYKFALSELINYLATKYPRFEDEKESDHEKAIKAKAFDIARGFLPAGVATFASWHTNLRQANDHLKYLRHHPVQEIRDLSVSMHEALREKYPSSFGHKRYEEEEAYVELCQRSFALFNDHAIDRFRVQNRLDIQALMEHEPILTQRPAKAELPKRLREFGDLVFTFPLDFGSYRDIQRQRSATIAMPILSTAHGFFPWYLEQLPASLRLTIEGKIKAQEEKIAALDTDYETKQYYTAMGYTITCKVVATLPSAVYIAELRSGQTVHPTLRAVAQRMTLAINEAVPGIALHSDMNGEVWSVKRGKQDIVKK